jgi:site-specific recombinase XerC
MILVRAVRQFGEARPVDAIPAAELRAWLLELRGPLAPESIAGYVRGLKAFGMWCAAEELAAAGGFRGLRRPKVPHRSLPLLRPGAGSLLALAGKRERALALVLLDTGLRLSELASLQVGDVRPDGTLHVMGKGAKERIVPIGASAGALSRDPDGRRRGRPLFGGRWGRVLSARGIQLAFARLGRRAAVGTRCSPHTFRHTFAWGISSTVVTCSACSRSSATQHSIWSAVTSACRRPTSSPAIERRHRRIGWSGSGGSQPRPS